MEVGLSTVYPRWYNVLDRVAVHICVSFAGWSTGIQLWLEESVLLCHGLIVLVCVCLYTHTCVCPCMCLHHATQLPNSLKLHYSAWLGSVPSPLQSDEKMSWEPKHFNKMERNRNRNGRQKMEKAVSWWLKEHADLFYFYILSFTTTQH